MTKNPMSTEKEAINQQNGRKALIKRRRNAIVRVLLFDVLGSLVISIPIITAIIIHQNWPNDISEALGIQTLCTVALLLLIYATSIAEQSIQKERYKQAINKSDKEHLRIGYCHIRWSNRIWISETQTKENEQHIERYLTYWSAYATSRMSPQISWTVDKRLNVISIEATSLPTQLIRPTEKGLKKLLEILKIDSSGSIHMRMTPYASGTEIFTPTSIESALRVACSDKISELGDQEFDIEIAVE